MSKSVIKRDGSTEPIDTDKIHRVLELASEGLDNISISQVEINSHLHLFDGIKTSDIHQTLIKSAVNLITEDAPDYDKFAARLVLQTVRKIAWGGDKPPHLYNHVRYMVELGKYTKELMSMYTEAEFDEMNSMLVHDRDRKFAYAGMEQLTGKYLVKDRVTDHIYETPQFAYLLIGAVLFNKYDNRMVWIKLFYDAVSLFKISLPTPIMSGVRTPTKQFSSCVLIDTDDYLDSIDAAGSAIIKYISQKAGIGLNIGKIRGLGSKIRKGEAFHTGLIPFIKFWQSAVKSCSQGGVRGGAATLNYPIFHWEVENLLVLKNNKGVEENRARNVDYCVQLNKLMYQRLQQNGHITLFSSNDTPGLYDSFYSDQAEFEKLYLKYEDDPSIRKKSVKAVDLFMTLAQERAQTGRIYIQNIDHCNTHSSFIESVAPIKMTNLCVEITLPTTAISHRNDPDGEIALCTLAAINLGELESLDELESLTELVVYALDALLDYQDYPLPAAEKAKKRRALGVGVVNYAYWLAKNGARYSDGSGNRITHELVEAFQYYLLKASNKLSQQLGPCEYFNETKYSLGVLPIDTYKKTVDSLCDNTLNYDWESLRESIKKYGLRNSTLSSLMPSETSSQISNATNGIEPPRAFISVKASKDGSLKQVVPELNRLKDKYELLWSMPSNKGYLDLVAIWQKFLDQSISANTNYDPEKFEGSKVPINVILKDLMYAYSLGLKTLYYHNTRDGANSSEEDGCAGGACKI